jgi:hypothetical protein
MSLSMSATQFDVAKETMRAFAETKPDTPAIVTKALEIEAPWGILRRIFCCCMKEKYLHRLDPGKSVNRFRARLSVLLSSREFKNNPALGNVCERACAGFNRLIRETNVELPSNRRIPETQLCINLEEEKSRITSQSKRPSRRANAAQSLGRGGTEEFSKADYDQLFGDTSESPTEPVRLSPGKKTDSSTIDLFVPKSLPGQDSASRASPSPSSNSGSGSEASKTGEQSPPQMAEPHSSQAAAPPPTAVGGQILPPAHPLFATDPHRSVQSLFSTS